MVGEPTRTTQLTPGRTVLCGPGRMTTRSPPAPTQPCHPGNEDGFRKEVLALGEALIPTLQLAAAKSVIVVKSAGNQRWLWCIDRATGLPVIPVRARRRSSRA